MVNEFYEEGKKQAIHTVWIFSDLQQGQPENARKCLDICMEDYELLGKPAELICYLGDSVESANLPHLHAMAEMQENAFGSLDIPLCYALGNHDFDYAEYCHRNHILEVEIPFYDVVRRHPGWHTTELVSDIYFRLPFGDDMFYFFSDHMGEDNSWCATHSYYRYGKENYPYTKEDYQKIHQEMADCGKRVLTFGHCAMPGGNRDSYLMHWLMPLPLNVRMHIYGHSHISDYMCAHERAFSQIQWVDFQDIPQIDVASFENIRGTFCRSVLMQIYVDGSLGFFFRNHDAHRFISAYFPPKETTELPGAYEKWAEFDYPWENHVYRRTNHN